MSFEDDIPTLDHEPNLEDILNEVRMYVTPTCTLAIAKWPVYTYDPYMQWTLWTEESTFLLWKVVLYMVY